MAFSKKFIRENKYIRLGLFVAFLAIVAMLFPRDKTSPFIYETGTSWVESDVIAPFTFPIYKDKSVYEKEKQAAREKVLPVFRRQASSFDEKSFNNLMDSLSAMLEQEARISSTDQSIPSMPPYPGLDRVNFSAKEKAILIADYRVHSSDENKALINRLRELIPKQVTVIHSDGVLNISRNELRSAKLVIRSENDREERVFDVNSFRDSIETIQTLRELISEKLIGSPASKEDANDTLKIATKLIIPFLEPNIIFDKRETNAARLRAESAVPIADGLVRENEKIISRGEKITPIVKRMLDSFMRAKAEREAVTGDVRIYLGKMIIVAIISAMFMIYVFLFREKIFQDNLMLALITLIILFELLITWYTLDFDQISPYIIPIGLASVLFTILFDSRISTFATVTIALLAAVIRGNDFQFAVASIFAGGLGVFSTRDIRKRSQIAISVVFIFLGYTLSIIGFSLSKLSPIRDILSDFLSAFISSIACFFVYPTLLLIEKIFGITTDLTLVELSDVNHPLLKDMALNAPGTYHHTMMVSMLSERAAAEVGANLLLCRVGAYFHDIGKTPNSQFFTENQGKENP
ncbi:MAG: HDIG domain-containing protein, partial [Chlorobiales bacterium]|nr:HDIG domain-containing protein [Chlorobiales bacterium]